VHLQPRGRVAVSGVDALFANDKSDAATIQLAERRPTKTRVLQKVVDTFIRGMAA
jgi:hypothetical protein